MIGSLIAMGLTLKVLDKVTDKEETKKKKNKKKDCMFNI